MDLSTILAISGKPGLYKILSQTKNGLIVESIEDGKKFPVFINDRSSALEDISVFTETEDLPLKEVFKKIYDKENGAKVPDAKTDKKEMLAYFESVLPDYDKDRVYASDVKKILAWYNLLVDKKIMEFKEDKPEKEEKVKETQADKKEDKKAETDSKAKPKATKAKAKPKATAVKTKTQKAQPAKGGATKNKGIGVKQK